VRDIKLANVSLLAKWRLSLLDVEPTLWKEVLVDKYESMSIHSGHAVGYVWPSNVSRWWKYIMLLEEEGGVGWFNRNWLGKWAMVWEPFFGRMLGSNLPLMEIFSRLFSISSCQEAKVGDMWGMNLEGESGALLGVESCLCGKETF